MFFKKKNKEIKSTFKYKMNDKTYKVVVTKKDIKKLYLRINEDSVISLNVPYNCTQKTVLNMIENNKDFINSALIKNDKNKIKNSKFLIFGEEKEIVIMKQFKKVKMVDNIIYTSDVKKLDNWLKNQTKKIFEERLNFIYDRFNENIPHPDLKIRKMKGKWGVCNITKCYITLNSNLIREPAHCLDYVIIHELSHLVYADHSKNFWELVSKYCPNYKQIRKELNS